MWPFEAEGLGLPLAPGAPAGRCADEDRAKARVESNSGGLGTGGVSLSMFFSCKRKLTDDTDSITASKEQGFQHFWSMLLSFGTTGFLVDGALEEIQQIRRKLLESAGMKTVEFCHGIRSM